MCASIIQTIRWLHKVGGDHVAESSPLHCEAAAGECCNRAMSAVWLSLPSWGKSDVKALIGCFRLHPCTAAVIVLYETQFPSSVGAKWEERLLWSITGEEGIIVHDCYVTGSLFHIYCNTGQMLSICARAHCHHLSQSCNYLGFLSAMWKSMLTRVYPQV